MQPHVRLYPAGVGQARLEGGSANHLQPGDQVRPFQPMDANAGKAAPGASAWHYRTALTVGVAQQTSP